MDSIKELLGHWKAKDTKCFKALQSIVDAIGTCGECKYFETETGGWNSCQINPTKEDWYCANFERKELE